LHTVQARIVLSPYLDAEIIQTVHQAVGQPVPSEESGGARRGGGGGGGGGDNDAIGEEIM
jgi:hypothetical protein